MAVAPLHPAIGQVLFFVGLVVPFTILLAVLMFSRLGYLREITVAIIGLYPAVVYRMSSPFVLGGYDEHLHEQTLLNFLRGSGLFAPNSVLKVGPYYPGLELFTGFTVRLTGLPVMLAMSLVVLLCRLLLVLIIYHAALLVNPSRRGASLVVAFYAVSQQFYSFNSQFSYQTLALTLGLGGLLLLRRAQFADYRSGRRLFFTASLVLIATVVTHHATSWVVLAFLIVWSVLSPKGRRRMPSRGAVVMGTAVAIWTTALSARLIYYFAPIFSTSLQTVQGFLAGTNGHRIFGANGGTAATPSWERIVLIVYTLTCTVAAMVCAWIMLSRAFHNRDRMLALLGVLDLTVPIALAAHFSPGTGALGDRASTFLFFPLALSCSLVIQRDPRLARRSGRRRKPFGAIALIALICGTATAYLGGTLLGSSPDWARLPGPYLVSAEARTQDPETIAAVDWAAAHLPAGSTVVADRIPSVLLASQARLWPVPQPELSLEPARLYFSDTWGPQRGANTLIVKGLHIDYLYVDTRLADSFPYVGYYIFEGETPEPTRISMADVDKFAHVPGLKAVYHHGPVTIYDTSGLGVVPQRHGFLSYHSMGLGPLDAILGAVASLFFLLSRTPLEWAKSVARDIGILGTTLVVITSAVFIGGVLFGLRMMPGPYFALGAALTAIAIRAVQRRADGLRIVPYPPLPDRLDPLLLFGFVIGVAGLTVVLRVAWITDVADVNSILRAVSR